MNARFYHFLYAIFLIFLCRCRENNPDQPPRLCWQSHQTGASALQTIYPISYQKHWIVSRSDSTCSVQVLSLEQQTGRLVWHYKDSVRHSPLYYNLQPAMHGHILSLPHHNRVIALDMRNGNLLWKSKTFDSGEQHLYAYGGFFYRICYDSQSTTYLVRMRAENGQSEVLSSFPRTADSVSTYWRTPVVYAVSPGDTLLFISSVVSHHTRKQFIPYWSIWSLKKRAFESHDTILPVNTFGWGITKQPVAGEKQGILYLLAKNQVIRYNMKTRAQEWRQEMPRDMLTSKILVCPDALYYACEDGFLYKLSHYTGEIIWKTKLSGTPGQVKIYRETLFVTGGSDEKCHAYDTQTGRERWTLPLQNEENTHFQRTIGLSESGFLLLNDKERFFCYQL